MRWSHTDHLARFFLYCLIMNMRCSYGLVGQFFMCVQRMVGWIIRVIIFMNLSVSLIFFEV